MRRAIFVRRGVQVALAVAVACTSAANTVLATPPTPASGATWAQSQEVDYRWKEGSEPPSWIRGAINAAAADVRQTGHARTPDFGYRAGATSWIGYTEDLPTNYAVGYAVRNVPHSFTIRLRPHGHVLDWGTLRWCQFYDSPTTGCYDAEMITLHEFGHVLTLGHADEDDVTEWTDTIMHASPKTKAKAGWNAHSFGSCDVARLQIRYEMRTAATPISTCLSLATHLGLAASPSGSVAYGSNVSFSATLKIDPGAAYASLAGDPLSARSVWLQRRPIGGSGWNDVAQLTSQSGNPGRYTRQLTVTGAYDYRARFASPTDEGISGATSAILRIAIGDPCVNSDVTGMSINAPTC